MNGVKKNLRSDKSYFAAACPMVNHAAKKLS